MPTQDNEQKKQAEKKVELDFGIGKISLTGFFQGIGNLIDFVSKLEEEGKTIEQTREFTSPSGRVKAVYGISVRTGSGGTPTIESFGNVKKTPQGPVVEEVRQPLVDVFDEQDHVLVIAELPGVGEEQIHSELKGDILILSAEDEDRKYYREMVLPADLDASTLKSSYKNGVLEIRISKKQQTV
jgi:HSP20 family protein